MTEADVRAELTRIVKKASPHGGELSFGPDEDLFKSGILDSVTLIAIIASIEGSFGVKITAAEYDPENFLTVSGMARMIKRLRARK